MNRTTRPLALGRHGMVSSPHELASRAGARILEQGGSAADASVTMNAVLSVVYPHMTGIGGDAFWLLYDAESRTVHALNGSGRAAGRATRGFFRDGGHEEIPEVGPLAALTVPGAVDSWQQAHDRFGALDLDTLLTPAINHAREGTPVAAGVARFTEEHTATLRRFPASARELLVDGRAPAHGDLRSSRPLASTLEAIAKMGRDGFYHGAVAEELVGSVQAAGGLLTMDDLQQHTSEWSDPISTTYRGLSCYQHPPNSQGIVHLMILNILEGFDVASLPADGAEYLHLVTEATKLAYAERERHITDPAFADIPVEHLLSKAYADELRTRISTTDANDSAPPQDPHGDTICTVAVDANGNAASVIQSLCHAFGSGFVAGQTGVLLHNRGSKFSLQEDHVNRLEPHKRTLHTLMPGMVLDDRGPLLVYGTMGGDGQPQTNTAVVTRVVDHQQDIQTAIDAPRTLFGQFWGQRTNDLWVEGRFPEDSLDGLRRRGQPVREIDDWADIMGHAQGIVIDRDRGILEGGSDPRGDGLAIGT